MKVLLKNKSIRTKSKLETPCSTKYLPSTKNQGKLLKSILHSQVLFNNLRILFMLRVMVSMT